MPSTSPCAQRVSSCEEKDIEKVMEKKELTTDILIIGGGTAGCYAAVTAARKSPKTRILVAEKANIQRSGCLAAGVNALNAWLGDGQTPQDYLSFVRRDAEQIIREDLVLTMAEGFHDAVTDLEKMGLVIQKNADGSYASRGSYNIRINGENIKPLLAKEVGRYPNITVLNHVILTDLLVTEAGRKRICGAVGLSADGSAAVAVSARAVLIATGGAAGLYRPNNPGFSRHKMWYPPFNTGAGYAMGIRAGAEMTSFEMRFVAQRCKDTIAPTGTIALGVGAREINARGEVIEKRYGLSTSGRAYGVTNENRQGRGPCFLRTKGISKQQEEDLLRAYLNMAPSQTLHWIESGRMPSVCNVEVEGTEPYIVGGHTGSGFWVDRDRRTTLRGLYAAGDAAGGAPKKFVPGALAEGKIAALSMLDDLPGLQQVPGESVQEQVQAYFADYESRIRPDSAIEAGGNDLFALEEAMQKVMDEYAGGIRTGYQYSTVRLGLAGARILELRSMAGALTVSSAEDLYRIYELLDRLDVCRTLIAHLQARRETRWPGFGIHTDYPIRNDQYALFINSVLLDGEIRMLFRPLDSR